MWLVSVDLLCSVIVIITLQQWAVKQNLLAKPGVFLSGNLVFLLGMLPWFDDLARYSISLHSLQSVMVHHFLPHYYGLALYVINSHLLSEHITPYRIGLLRY